MLKKLFNKFKEDYRHIICSSAILISTVCALLFPNSIPRLIETIRDLITSIIFYFFEIFGSSGNAVFPYVVRFQKWKFADEIWKPVKILPYSLEEFLQWFDTLFKLLFNKSNLREYLIYLSNFIDVLYKLLLVLLPFVVIIWFHTYTEKNTKSNARNFKTRAMQRFEYILFNFVYPIIAWLKDFIDFLQEYIIYVNLLIIIWCLHFNIFSIVIAALSYYFYFISSWDIASIYIQLLKLQLDITPVVRFIPAVIWAVIFYIVYDRITKSMAFNRLYYYDRANKAFVRKLGNITTVYGEPGAGKTKLVTALALTQEIRMYDDALEIMLTRASQFPNFPWQNFVDFLNKQISDRIIVDAFSAREEVRYLRWWYELITDELSYDEWQEICLQDPELVDPLFNYDYDHYSLTYNDELKIHHLFDAMESYAAAYVMFSVETSLIFANYSIRVDSLLKDYGNMPFRDNNFLERPTEYQEAYSLHSHIFDFDILRRFGKQIVQNNENARIAPCGVIVVSEIDKEFKNSLKLKETKADTSEANQKNDLHDACLTMIRHAVVIDFVSFVSVICDLQRPEAWGASGRELGQVYFISDKSDIVPALPFFSLHWIIEGLFKLCIGALDSYDRAYGINRSDNTLLIYLVRNINTFMKTYLDRINGKYGVQELTLEYQSGRMDGEIKTDKFRIISKIHLSNRYRTDCLASIFETYEPNTMHIDDFKMYAGELATQGECAGQHSYFQNDIKKMKGR